MARGRPQKPYHPTFGGDPIPGLYKCPDGRWRINFTGEKYTEHDERRAVQKFLDWKSKNRPEAVVHFPVEMATADPPAVAPVGQWDGNIVTTDNARMGAALYDEARRLGIDPAADKPSLAYPLPEVVVWPWVRQQFFARPEYVARMLGVSVEAVRNMPLAKPSLKLEALIKVYREQNPSTDKAKARCVSIFRRLMDHAGAATLDDLTTEKLSAFRQSIENDKDIQSAGTKVWMYGQVKSLISFGTKVGLDAAQLDAALSRCGVLWTPDPLPDLKPNPISKADFHRLLDKVGDGPWRAWLLVGLNFCLHMDEVCGVQCKHINVEAGTYACIRTKTRRERVPRAAVLWPETLDAIRPLLGKPYLFTSPRGTRYSVNSRCNLFADLRTKAGLPDTVTFDSVRDAAYTAACQARTDDKWARVLSGQRAEGLQDNYVLRNPACVQPACDAVYAAYGPFPSPARP